MPPPVGSPGGDYPPQPPPLQGYPPRQPPGYPVWPPDQAPLGPPGWVLVPATGPLARWPGIGVLISRSAAVFLSAPWTFLAVGLVSAIPSLVALPFTAVVRSGSTTSAIGFATFVGLVALVFSYLTTVLVTMATVDVTSGQTPRFIAVVGRSPGPFARALVTTLTLFLIVVGVVLIAGAIVAVTVLGGLASLGVIGAIALGFVAVALAIRVSLYVVVAVVEGRTALDALRRSFELTRGLAWRLFGLSLVVFLAVGLPASAVSLAADTLPSPVSLIVSAIATAVTAPAIAIATTVAYLALAEQPWNVARTAPHAPALAMIAAVVGFIAVFAIGVATAPSMGTFGPSVFNPNAGRVLFGHSPGPVGDECSVGDPSTSFNTADQVYVGANFNRFLGTGTTATVHFTLNGQPLIDAPLTTTSTADCYYEPTPLTNLKPGTYRLWVEVEGTIISDGTFTVA
jgi:hypothetical protein